MISSLLSTHLMCSNDVVSDDEDTTTTTTTTTTSTSNNGHNDYDDSSNKSTKNGFNSVGLFLVRLAQLR